MIAGFNRGDSSMPKHAWTLACVCLLGLATAATAATAQTPPAAGAPSPAAPQPAAPAPAMQHPAPMAAPAAPPARIRGTISAVGHDRLTIKSRDGMTVEVALQQPVTVMTLRRVPLAEIRDGSYVGVASRSGPHDTQVALEVLVFPLKMRGVGAGHYGWDLQPGSMMTNAPVTGVMKARSGRDLTLTYAGGSVTIHVPPHAPVVTLAPASEADLKRGRKVFFVAQKAADGSLTASRITVGTHGVNPPM
jgi:hypothetical protein